MGRHRHTPPTHPPRVRLVAVRRPADPWFPPLCALIVLAFLACLPLLLP